MRVRLIKKFAEMIDGIDLRGRCVGDLFNLKAKEARLLIAEQWAVPGDERGSHFIPPHAADSRPPRAKQTAGPTVPDTEPKRST
jgi:hypothetical protein